MNTFIRPALVLFLLLSLVCGVIYPYAMAGVGHVLFADKVQGSLITRDGHLVGSSLIGQSFTAPHYFWGRPSATAGMPNNASASGGSNLGPLNPALLAAVKGRIDSLKAADPHNTLPIPVDLVTASASGLDPDISVAAAMYQASRIARERQLPLHVVQALIQAHTQARYGGFFGEPRVNVLELNLRLDGDTRVPK